jgi:hypothetical protein
METLDLLSICGAAFLGVFILLSVLALVMRLILIIFPDTKAGIDAAMLAAVTTAIQTRFPGTRITRVEEVK